MIEIVGTILVLLGMAVVAYIGSKKTHIPYPILLFVFGLAAGVVTMATGGTIPFYLTPDLLFFVFLPFLIFEAGYNIRYYTLSQNYRAVRLLSILGVILSTLIVGMGGRLVLGLFGVDVPLIALLLLGAIISPTDPVAILAICKEVGIPKRLYLLFESASLFNDGTALAIFVLLTGAIATLQTEGSLSSHYLLVGTGQFIVKILLGIGVGIVMGVLFSYIIKSIKNHTPIEIILTILSAHTTFLLAEYISKYQAPWGWDIHISSVIATAYAAIIIGNYGKTKISPKVEVHMEHFWEFFAFLCNALVFLLMGLSIADITPPPIRVVSVISILLCISIIAKACAVYIPLSILHMLGRKNGIPMTRQHLLAWGGLRGALSLVLVLLVPPQLELVGRGIPYPVHDFLFLTTISVIIFAMIVQGCSITPIIRRLGIHTLHNKEQFEKYESEIITYTHMIEKIIYMKETYHISEKSYEILLSIYTSKKNMAILNMKQFLGSINEPAQLIQQVISLHAIGIEKFYLKEMYTYNEIPEHVYNYLLLQLDKQAGRLRNNEKQIKGFDIPRSEKPVYHRDPIVALMNHLQHIKTSVHDNYLLYRARIILSNRVIQALHEHKTIEMGYDMGIVDQVIELYQTFHTRAYDQLMTISSTAQEEIDLIDSILLHKGLLKTEDQLMRSLYSKEMICEHVYKDFMSDIECELLKNY